MSKRKHQRGEHGAHVPDALLGPNMAAQPTEHDDNGDDAPDSSTGGDVADSHSMVEEASAVGAAPFAVDAPPVATEPKAAQPPQAAVFAPGQVNVAPPVGALTCRILQRVCARGFNMNGHVQNHWEPLQVGSFPSDVVSSAPHCFEKLTP